MFVQPEDLVRLAGLGGRPFEEILLDLVRDEASRHGIPPHTVHWDHRTNLPDGGRDIVVEGRHTDPVPRFIPQRSSIWSAKSGKDGTQPATLRQELTADHHEEVRRHLQNGNPYIWCMLQPIDENGRVALRQKVREVAETEFFFNPDLVEFRTLTDLCTLLNDHPGLIAKHLPDTARPFEGVHSLREWEREDRFAVGWVDFGDRAGFIAQLQSHFRSLAEPNVLHVAGLSGIGKTRTVREACGAEDLAGVLYVPRYDLFTDRFLRHLTRNENLMARVVLDEVPLSEVAGFSARVRDFSRRLRFITIGPALGNGRSRPSANILVLPEPETEAGVLAVVRQAGIGLVDPVIESIARFSAHDLRLALMLVEATKQDGAFRNLPIQDGDDVWNRVTRLFRDRIGNLDSFRDYYPFLTVSIDLGCTGELRQELQHVAMEFAVSVQRLDEVICVAESCGLGVRTPGFFEASPRALAGHLFRHRLWPGIEPRIHGFLERLPDRLLRRFVERCQECTGPAREEMENALAGFFWSELGPPDVTQLIDRNRSRLFATWAELDPINGLEWLRQATGSASDEQLAALDGKPDGSGGWRGRRQVVWLCESLASFGEYFPACEAILFRLAQVETEPSIGNNSTATWREMFLPVLAFTETPFPERADLLLRRMSASNERTLSLILSAVVEALDVPGMRMAPPTIVGGRVVPEPWSPATHADLFRLQREFGQRALELVGRLPIPLLPLGRQAIVANLRVFVRLGLIDELRRQLDASDEECKRSLLLQLRRIIEVRNDSLARRTGSQSDPVLPELRRWEENLRPVDLMGRLQELTALDYWEVMRLNRGTNDPLSSSSYARLAQEALGEPDVVRQLEDWFESDKARSAFNFAVALGELDQHDTLLATIASWLEAGRCRSMVAGYLRGVGTRHGSLPADWAQRLDQATARQSEYGGLVTVNVDFSLAGFQRVMCQIEAGALPPTILTAFNSPNWASHIGLQQRLQMLELLLRIQPRDDSQVLGAALSLAENWTDFGQAPLPPNLAEPAIQLLRASLGVCVDAGAWSNLLESISAEHPAATADLATDALTSTGPLRVVLQDLILPVLLKLARRHPRLVMEAIGQRILDPERRIFFGILSFSGLFEAIGLAEVQRWVEDHGVEPIRYVARHLDSPRIVDGTPLIPAVTNWVLTQFGGDDRIFGEYCMGRHAFEVQAGHARDRRAELEQALEPFRNSELAWVRRWVEYELRRNDRDAELDDLMQDRQERM